MQDVLINTIGGGVIGGFFGSLIIWKLDQRTQANARKRNLVGALKAIRTELIGNKTSLVAAYEVGANNLPLRDDVYRMVVLSLATNIDKQAYVTIASFYETVPLFRADMELRAAENKKSEHYKKKISESLHFASKAASEAIRVVNDIIKNLER